MRSTFFSKILLVIAMFITALVYWPGLAGSWLFDDYPNVVENHSVQPNEASLASLVDAALSSPSSDFKRPLASLSFAVNYLITGLNPFWMKLTNLAIHLVNGLLVFLLARSLLALTNPYGDRKRTEMAAVLVSAGWMLLPINLTAVLYVVQRMESMANLFVLAGLIGYVAGRQRMRRDSASALEQRKGLLLCIASVTIPTAIGTMAKETAVMLPLYALLTEWIIFDFGRSATHFASDAPPHRDRRIISLFAIALVLPMFAGLIWLTPWLDNPVTWASRDFSLTTRLLSEARIIAGYIAWTILPTPGGLSFYHDDFKISTGLLSPWSTLSSIILLLVLIGSAIWLRRKRPLLSLGIAFFIACHLLTGTVLPLELIYEHRNYFASFGLMLAVIPLLFPTTKEPARQAHSFALARGTLLFGLLSLWCAETAITALDWSNPLTLAKSLATRDPNSPRAEYELGRTYIIYSGYDPESPFTRLAYAPLEKAMSLPGASILPEQALIFMNSRMHVPIKDAWWKSLVGKLKDRKTTVQDESSLSTLTDCAISKDHECELPREELQEAFFAALSHPNPSARLLALYANFAWNGMNDRDLGLRMITLAVSGSPTETAYRVTMIRMLAAMGRYQDAKRELATLGRLNYGGRLNASLAELQQLPGVGANSGKDDSK